MMTMMMTMIMIVVIDTLFTPIAMPSTMIMPVIVAITVNPLRVRLLLPPLQLATGKHRHVSGNTFTHWLLIPSQSKSKMNLERGDADGSP